MKLPGIVTNVTNFGAFVDVGVHQDGLVHISQLADHFIEDPADVEVGFLRRLAAVSPQTYSCFVYHAGMGCTVYQLPLATLSLPQA